MVLLGIGVMPALSREADPVIVLPPIDVAKQLEADRLRAGKGEPVHYAVAVQRGEWSGSAEGAWTALPDGAWHWSLAVESPNATSIDIGFRDFWLPNGAELRVVSADGMLLAGPWSDAHNNPSRSLWTPAVPGPEVRLELDVPAGLREFVSLEIGQVNAGYRLFNDVAPKALSCNIDVVCPEGDDYRDQIRSVAAITIGASTALCTGQLLNNTAENARPLLLTANHCDIGTSDAASLVFYFNYQSDTCRSGAASGNPLPRSLGDALSGARLLANHGPRADFALLELSTVPPDEFGVYYAGWDRRDVASASAAIVHHPDGDEKRISLELDPVTSGTERFAIGDVDLAPGTWWEVAEYDAGVTEGGSSGGGLFNAAGRVVGQLAGGAVFSCPGAEEGPDAFGKLSASWEGGGTPETRLSDWLDPGDTGRQFLDGSDGCDRPSVQILSATASARVGDLVPLSSSVSGGEPPYTYAWDVDGDGAVDSTLAELEARFRRGGQTNVELTVTDAAGCPATARFGLPVSAPRLEVTGQEAPVEVCGDDDGLIERGELWRFPLIIGNTGNAPATAALAAFAVSPAGADDGTIGPDGFGYTARDTAAGFCPNQLVDLAATGTALVLDDRDDGAAVVDLDGEPFDFYGEPVGSLLVSSNGYLSTDVAEDGADFTNDCPLPDPPGNSDGGRIAPLHDDLVVEGEVRHGFFETCPRAAPAGDPDQSCDVFGWDDVRYFSGASGTFDFQAILYRENHDIVFQYGPGNPRSGNGSTTAIQSAGAEFALTYACNQAGSLADTGAVCFFHPDSTPPVQSDRVELLTPTIDIPQLPAGSATLANLEVRIGEDIPCGSFLAIDYLGAGRAGGFNPGAAAVVVAEISGDPCESDTQCAEPLTPQFAPREGFWFNNSRPGTGMDLHFRSGLYGAWYTALPGGAPIWYYLQTLSGQQLQRNQIHSELLRFTGPLEAADFTVVGDATLSFAGPSRGLMTWTLDGKADGEIIQYFDIDSDPGVDPEVTDQWFAPTEPGWGYGIQRQGSNQFTAVYFYAEDGSPVWAVTLDADALFLTGLSPLGVFDSHCPSCAWTTPTFIQRGFLQLNLDPGAGETDIEIQAPTVGGQQIDWQRAELPIVPIGSVIGR